MKELIAPLATTLLLAALTACGPTTQEYSDALSGTWSRMLEDSDDGVYDHGVIYLTFDPIPEGSDQSTVTAVNEGTIEVDDDEPYTADYKISVKGTYIIDEFSDYPLDMRWDIKTLSVDVDNVKIKNVQTDFAASLYDAAGAMFGMNVDTRKSIANTIKKDVKSLCKQQLQERNDDAGAYGLDFRDNTLYLSGEDFSVAFSRVE